MACAANYAWVNRSSMTFLCRQARSLPYRLRSPLVALLRFFRRSMGGWRDRGHSASPQAFAKMFNSTPDDLDMHVVYDVSHNIAKVRLAPGLGKSGSLRPRQRALSSTLHCAMRLE